MHRCIDGRGCVLRGPEWWDYAMRCLGRGTAADELVCMRVSQGFRAWRQSLAEILLVIESHFAMTQTIAMGAELSSFPLHLQSYLPVPITFTTSSETAAVGALAVSSTKSVE